MWPHPLNCVHTCVRLLFLWRSSRCGYYSRAATIRGAASIRINTVFIDEMGKDRRNCMRRFGYSVRGKPPLRNSWYGVRVSAIAAMSTNGITDCHTVCSSVNGDEFMYFLQHILVPHLQPFDGVNPHGVVVMDNASIHHVDRAVQLIEATGELVQFFPPYSPELNPIEEAFSMLKSTLQANEQLLDIDCESLVLCVFTAITPDDCRHWIYTLDIFNYHHFMDFVQELMIFIITS